MCPATQKHPATTSPVIHFLGLCCTTHPLDLRPCASLPSTPHASHSVVLFFTRGFVLHISVVSLLFSQEIHIAARRAQAGFSLREPTYRNTYIKNFGVRTNFIVPSIDEHLSSRITDREKHAVSSHTDALREVLTARRT